MAMANNIALVFASSGLLRTHGLTLELRTYRAIRQAVGAQRKFFDDLQALTRYLYFDSWQQLLTYMFQGLELESG